MIAPAPAPNLRKSRRAIVAARPRASQPVIIALLRRRKAEFKFWFRVKLYFRRAFCVKPKSTAQIDKIRCGSFRNLLTLKFPLGVVSASITETDLIAAQSSVFLVQKRSSAAAEAGAPQAFQPAPVD